MHYVYAGPPDCEARVQMTGGTGSYLYMAPEIFRYEPYNTKADIYSLAMVIYEMLAGHRPFEHLAPPHATHAAAYNGLRPHWDSIAPRCYTEKECALLPEVRALVERCWASYPGARCALKPCMSTMRMVSCIYTGPPRYISGGGESLCVL